MSTGSYPKLTLFGEDALLVEFEPSVSLPVNSKVRQLSFVIEQEGLTGLAEVVPAYRSLMIYFDPLQTDIAELTREVRIRARQALDVRLPQPRLFRIPTAYGATYGPDLERVAVSVGLSQEEVVRLFSAGRYPVYCLGFLCGLAYLGGVPQRLQLPRLATPRAWLPAGSVGIAGAQAAMLPIDQPSGFHFLGRTFVCLYDPRQHPPTPIQPGDLVECPAVPESEARAWEGRPCGACLLENIPCS